MYLYSDFFLKISKLLNLLIYYHLELRNSKQKPLLSLEHLPWFNFSLFLHSKNKKVYVLEEIHSRHLSLALLPKIYIWIQQSAV